MSKPRKRSAAQTAKRERQFREWLGRRTNPIRATMALPNDIDLDDVDWNPSHAEKAFSKLAAIDAAFEKQELAYLRRRCKALEAMVQGDLRWLAAHPDD